MKKVFTCRNTRRHALQTHNTCWFPQWQIYLQPKLQYFVLKLNPNKHTLGTKILAQQGNEASQWAEWRRLQESGEGCLKPPHQEDPIGWNPGLGKFDCLKS